MDAKRPTERYDAERRNENLNPNTHTDFQE